MPYSEADAEFFFGREADTDIIAANAKTSRLTLLYGASGVGKSSVLLAGVVPKLRELGREHVDGKASFAVAVLRSWRRAPLESLREAIRTGVGAALGKEVEDPDPAAPLVEALRAWTTEVRTLLVVLDQFEDYFLYHAHEDGEGTFAVEFPRAINDSALRVNFLVSLREDAWSKLDRFEGRIPNLFGNYVRVEHLDEESAKRAIVRPIEKYNEGLPEGEPRFSIEPGLVTAVLNQVKTGRIALADTQGVGTLPQAASQQIETPFLQLVMERLWRATVTEGSRELREETLQDLGGAQRIVEQALAESLHALTPEEQEVAAEVFRYLITPSKTKIAQRTSDLAFWTKRSEDEIEPVLDKLSRARGDRIRILRPIALPAGESGSMYEIFHDVLAEPILEWRTQHEQSRERRELAKRLKAEQDERDRETRNRRIRRALVIAIVVAGALAALASVAFVQKSNATRARKAADSRALGQGALAKLAIDPAQSVADAAKGIRLRPTTEAEGALRTALGRSFVSRILRVGAPLTSAAFTADGRRIVAAANDGTIRVWDGGHRQVVLRGAKGSVADATFSRDGTDVLAGGDSGTAFFWHASGGPPVKLPSGFGTVVAALSSDGRLAATAGGDGLLRLWRVPAGKELGAPRHGHTNEVTAIAFSPDGRRVATASADQTVRVWTAPFRRSIVLRGHHDVVSSVSFSHDGRLLLSTSPDGTARVWAAATGRPVAVVAGGKGTTDAQFSGDARGFVTANANGTATIWTIHGRRVRTLRPGPAATTAASFSPDGKLIVTVNADNTARIWNALTGSPIALLRGHTGTITEAGFSPDSRRIVTASDDGTLRVWTVPVQPKPIVFRRPPTALVSKLLLAAAFASNGDVLAAGGDGTVRAWTSPAHSRIAVQSGGSAYIASLSTDGTRVAIAGGGPLEIWNVQTGHRLRLVHSATSLSAVAFNRDGNLVVTAGGDGFVRIFDATTGSGQSSTKTGSVRAVALSPDGKLIATGGDQGAAIWKPGTTRPSALLPTGRAVLTVAFSRDGTVVATGSDDGTAQLWEKDHSRWHALVVLRGHKDAVSSIAFDPVGRVVATTGADGTVRLWDQSSGRSLGVFRAKGKLLSVAFSAGGRRVVSASYDGVARVYPCDVCGSLKDLLQLADRVPR